jgi:hypothetical protein
LPRKVGTRKLTREIEFVIKSESFEITTRGAVADIARDLPGLAKFASQAEKEIVSLGVATPTPEGEETPPPSDAPVIKPQKSTTDNIRSLFGTTWGRRPRALDQVCSALELNAVPDRRDNVNVYLRRLVKSGYLRRLKKGTQWSYYKVPE